MPPYHRSEEHTSELQSHDNLVCRLLLEKKKRQATHRKRLRIHVAVAAHTRLGASPPRVASERRRRSARTRPSAPVPQPFFFFKNNAPPESPPSSPPAPFRV